MSRKTAVVNVRVPLPLHAAIATHAGSHGESPAWATRDLLRRGLATVNPDAQPDPERATRRIERGAPGPAKLKERFAATARKGARRGR